MNQKNFGSLRMITFLTALALSGAMISGCSGAGDANPTNTGKSTYNNKGTSAADKIGALRMKRRLMSGGPKPDSQ
ncbi:MAG TPA: hypothetical protein VGL56_16290 [Fimbriimonadaceae bacterium]|jgi:hypothetical protein